MKRTLTILATATIAVFSFAAVAQALGPAPVVVHPEGKLSHLTAGLSLAGGDLFGSGVCVVGDIDGDGVDDLAVGAEGTDGAALSASGAVWILLMNADGSIKTANQVHAGSAVMTGFLSADDEFGSSVAAIGNVDGQGGPDIVVGAPNEDAWDSNGDNTDGGFGINRGAIYILFLNTDGTVRKAQKIDDTDPVIAIPNNSDQLGDAVTSCGDLDGAGGSDIAIAAGAPGDRVAGFLRGAVWVIFMTYNAGTDLMDVDSWTKIADETGTPGSFSLTNSVTFGTSLSTLPDMNADGRRELVVGSNLDDDNDPNVVSLAINRGAAYVMYPAADGTITAFQKISDTAGGFTGVLEDSDFFGDSVQGIDDLDGDGNPELAVGAGGDDDGGNGRGAVYLLYLNATANVKAHVKISDTEGEFDAAIDDDDMLGNALGVSDLDNNGFPELLMGAQGDDDGSGSAGAVHIGHLAGPPTALCKNVTILGDDTGGVCTADTVDASEVDNGSNDPQGLAITLALDPTAPYPLGDTSVRLIVTNSAGLSDTCDAVVTVECAVAVKLSAVSVARSGNGATLTWEVAEAFDHLGFNVYREANGSGRIQINDEFLSGRQSYEFVDANAPRGAVDYWLAEVGRSGAVAWHGPFTLASAGPISSALVMAPAQPNPFSASTRIAYSVPDSRLVNLAVYDILGRQVTVLVNEIQSAGQYTVAWDGRTSQGERAVVGLYFLKLQAGSESLVQKMVLSQ